MYTTSRMNYHKRPDCKRVYRYIDLCEVKGSPFTNSTYWASTGRLRTMKQMGDIHGGGGTVSSLLKMNFDTDTTRDSSTLSKTRSIFKLSKKRTVQQSQPTLKIRSSISNRPTTAATYKQIKKIVTEYNEFETLKQNQATIFNRVHERKDSMKPQFKKQDTSAFKLTMRPHTAK